MKLYSDTLTSDDIRSAAREAGVYVCRLTAIGRPRVRRNGWTLNLSGSSSYRSQATYEQAATWDEHGVFMASLYRKDPSLRIAFYRDLAHFLAFTKDARDSWYNRNQPESKRVSAPWLADRKLQKLA